MSLHQPILLQEVLNEIDFESNQIIVDGTFGRGGHSKAILNKLNQNSQLIALDKDTEAVEYAKNYIQDKRFIIYQSDYQQIDSVLSNQSINQINMVLLDIGICSTHIDQPKRGFSYRFDAKLDMRFDTQQDLDAHKYLNQVPLEELISVLFKYGEERMSRKIARKIVSKRESNQMNTTQDLKQAILEVLGSDFKAKSSYNKVFQAIRIVVNQELESLKNALENYFKALIQYGKMLIITFHSLEDKVLKSFIYDKNEEYLVKEIPIQPEKKIKIQKKIKPSKEEVEQNSRSKSAKLYVLIKLV